MPNRKIMSGGFESREGHHHENNDIDANEDGTFDYNIYIVNSEGQFVFLANGTLRNPPVHILPIPEHYEYDAWAIVDDEGHTTDSGWFTSPAERDTFIAQHHVFGQEGGKKNFDKLRIKSRHKTQLLSNILTPNEMPNEMTVLNSMRTYKAIIDDIPMIGRYFHGSPAAAGRKVISSLVRIDNRDLLGINKAIRIVLIEITRGVRKSDHSQYQYQYFGWRQRLDTPKDIKKIDKNGKHIVVNYHNIVIPTRGQTSVIDAKKRHDVIGAKIRANRPVNSKPVKPMKHVKPVSSLIKRIPKD